MIQPLLFLLLFINSIIIVQQSIFYKALLCNILTYEWLFFKGKGIASRRSDTILLELSEYMLKTSKVYLTSKEIESVIKTTANDE